MPNEENIYFTKKTNENQELGCRKKIFILWRKRMKNKNAVYFYEEKRNEFFMKEKKNKLLWRHEDDTAFDGDEILLIWLKRSFMWNDMKKENYFERRF